MRSRSCTRAFCARHPGAAALIRGESAAGALRARAGGSAPAGDELWTTAVLALENADGVHAEPARAYLRGVWVAAEDERATDATSMVLFPFMLKGAAALAVLPADCMSADTVCKALGKFLARESARYLCNVRALVALLDALPADLSLPFAELCAWLETVECDCASRRCMACALAIRVLCSPRFRDRLTREERADVFTSFFRGARRRCEHFWCALFAAFHDVADRAALPRPADADGWLRACAGASRELVVEECKE